MRYLRFIIIISLIAGFAVSGAARKRTDYSTLEVKAERFFFYKEWASACAMYELMLDQKPTVVSTYCKSIVAAGMDNNTKLQASLLKRSEQYAVAFDSLFSGIRNISIKLTEPKIYINFMNLVKEAQPWLSRTIDIKLLNFYVFRSNADAMISTALSLLIATPDNIQFLSAVADGYALKGDYDKSMEYYNKILTYQPDNLQALLTLGNYYNLLVDKELKELSLSRSLLLDVNVKTPITFQESSAAKIRHNIELAVNYLGQSAEIKPTPYLQNTIEQLHSLLLKIY